MVCEFFDDDLDYQENMLARYYHRAGHEVTVVASTIRSLTDYVSDGDRGQGPRSEERYEWGRLIRVPFRFNLLHRFKRFEPILPLIEEMKPDLLFFHDIIPNMSEGVRYVRANPDCAMIMDYHGDASNSGANWASRRILHGVIRKAILDRARPCLRKILPVTPGSAEFLGALYGIPDKEMELLPLGTDQLYAAEVKSGDARRRIRSDLGIPDDAFVIFTGGKLNPLKRTRDVLIAAAKGPDDIPVHVILVGSADPAYEEYARSVMDLGDANPRIHAVGWQDRAGVYAHMAAADIAVFPASQSVLWQQSLGMGLPLILSEKSEAQRAVQHVGYLNRHDNLIILDPDQPLPDQIAAHVKRLAGDRETLAAMSGGALRTAAEILDYAAIAARTLEFAQDDNKEHGVADCGDRKTILFIGPIPPPITGQSLACEVFLKALREKHDVILIDINKSDFSSGGLVWARVKEIAGILRQVRREAGRADAVYFTITESLLGNAKDMLIYLACWRLLPRMVVHLHGGAGMIRLLHGPTGFLRRINAFFLERMAAVIVLGDRLRRVYEGAVSESKLRVVVNFAEDVYQLPVNAIEAKFANQAPLRVLYLSNMIAEKGYLLLQGAVRAIASERPGTIQLDYAGGFVTEEDKAKFLASIADCPFIRYHGIVRGDEKMQLLRQAHILSLPTYYPFEGQPICILEGYAAGCAVLTTDHSGIFDVFTPGENGWAVEKRSSRSVEAALRHCMGNPEAVAEAGQRNALLAKERFTAKRYNDALLEIVGEALGRPL